MEIRKYDGHYAVPGERVADVAASMSGAVVVGDDDSPRARQAFKDAGLHVYGLKTTRTSGSRGTVPTTELIATNFALPAKVRVRKRR